MHHRNDFQRRLFFHIVRLMVLQESDTAQPLHLQVQGNTQAWPHIGVRS